MLANEKNAIHIRMKKIRKAQSVEKDKIKAQSRKSRADLFATYIGINIVTVTFYA